MADRDFFDIGSPYLSHPLLTPERTATEVDRIVERVGSVDSVLDVGCGFGRHSVEFARRGAAVIGLDPSPAMCAAARSRAVEAGVEIAIHEATTAALDALVTDPVDLALLLFSSLGQRGRDDRSPVEQLRSVVDVVRPGGNVVIEVPDRQRAVAALVAHEQLGPTTVTRSFDPDSSVLTERFDTPTGLFRLELELFDRAGLLTLAETAGLRVDLALDHALVEPPPTLSTVFARRVDA